MATASSTTSKTSSTKDTVAAVRKDLTKAQDAITVLTQHITAMHGVIEALRTQAVSTPQAPARLTHEQQQAQALQGMKEAAPDDQNLIEWVDRALGRLETNGAFSKNSNVWKVVGRRASTPQERIERYRSMAAQQASTPQAAALPALPPLPPLPNAGGTEHDEDESDDTDTSPEDPDEPPFG